MNEPIFFPTTAFIKKQVQAGNPYLMVSTKDGSRMWVFGANPRDLYNLAETQGHTDIAVFEVLPLLLLCGPE